MTNNIDKPLCDHCGQTLEHFLNQMEQHNQEVVCPACGKTLINGSQKERAEDSEAGQHGPNPPAKRSDSADPSHTNSSAHKSH
jgi:predicted RNA-binding Zn-ribbon protein involved in translation (DUF1610 family)